MTKKTADKWLYRIYRMLDTLPVQVRLSRKIPDDHGIAICQDNDPSKGTVGIILNPDKSEFMGTLVHECLHLVDWKMSEPAVARLEKGMMCKLTDRQLMNLLHRIVAYHTKKE